MFPFGDVAVQFGIDVYQNLSKPDLEYDDDDA